MLHHIFSPFQDPKSTKHKLPLFFQMYRIEHDLLFNKKRFLQSLVAKLQKGQGPNISSSQFQKVW